MWRYSYNYATLFMFSKCIISQRYSPDEPFIRGIMKEKLNCRRKSILATVSWHLCCNLSMATELFIITLLKLFLYLVLNLFSVLFVLIAYCFEMSKKRMHKYKINPTSRTTEVIILQNNNLSVPWFKHSLQIPSPLAKVPVLGKEERKRRSKQQDRWTLFQRQWV